MTGGNAPDVGRAPGSTPTPLAAAAPLTEAQVRRNFRLGVLNGAVYQGGENFIDSSTVIPVFVSRLTSSNALIGLASALGDLGWLLPQVFVAPWASRLPKQLWLYRRAALVRATALFALAALAWPLRHRPGALLAAYFVLYGIYSFGAGVGGVAFMEVVGRTVPRERLGSYFAQRMFWGGSLGALSGLLVRQILDANDTGVAFVVLFALAGVVCSSGYALFSSIREPDVPIQPMARASPVELLRHGFAWFRDDPIFRRLIVARGSLSVWLTASPFIVLFTVRELGGGAGAAGTFLMARVAGFVLSNVGWHQLSKRRGNRAVMRVATGAACGLSLVAAGLAVLSPWSLGVLSRSATVIALEIVSLAGGAAHSGLLVAYGSLVIELAPVGARQGFVSMINTFLGPTMLLPMLGGLVVDATNAPALFALCAGAGLIGFRAAARLPERSSSVALPVPRSEEIPT